MVSDLRRSLSPSPSRLTFASRSPSEARSSSLRSHSSSSWQSSRSLSSAAQHAARTRVVSDYSDSRARGYAAAAGRSSRCPVPVPRGTRTRGLRLLAPCAFRLALRQGLGRRSAVPHTTYHILLPQEEVRGRGPRQTRVSERRTGQATQARPAPSAWGRREVRVLGTRIMPCSTNFNTSST